eukprot:367018_1
MSSKTVCYIVCVALWINFNKTLSSITWRKSDVPITELEETYGAFIAYHNNTVHILGGAKSQNRLFEFPLNVEWKKKTNITFPGWQWSQSSIQIDDQLWMLPVGSKSLVIFNLNEYHITQTIQFPGSAITATCVTSYIGYILVLGGATEYWSDPNSPTSIKEFNVYNTLTKSWSYGTSLMTRNAYHSCNVVGDTIYIIGGDDGSQHLDNVEYLELMTCCSGTWQQMSHTLSQHFFRHRSIVFEEKIYVIGGSNSNDQIDIIDTVLKTISSPFTNKLIYAKQDVSAILINNIIYVFGGEPIGTTNIHYQYAAVGPTISPTINPTTAPTTHTNLPTTTPIRYPSISPILPNNTPTLLPTLSTTIYIHPIISPTSQNENNNMFYITLGVIFLMAFFSLLAFGYNKKDKSKTDDADWKVLLLLGISVGDFISDILLCLEIFSHFGDSTRNRSPNDLLLLHIAGIGPVIFIVLPYSINIYTLWTFDQFIADNKSAIIHFKQYRFLFIAIMLCTGSTYIAAALLSSKLFGFQILCSGLTKYEMSKLSKLKVFGSVLAENIPQLIILIIYAVYQAQYPSNIFTMSCILSLLSIISALLVYLMERRSANYVVAQYELEFLTNNEHQLTQTEIDQICQTKERKKALGNALGMALNIDSKLLEIGEVTIGNNGVNIKMNHYLFVDELILDKTNYLLITNLYDNNQ